MPTPAINPDYSINRLVIGVWKDAERKARQGDEAAREWLYSEGVLWLEVILNIHPDHIRRYLRRALRRRKPKANRETQGKKKVIRTRDTLQNIPI